MSKRILIIFTSIPLLGIERGNLEAVLALREQGFDVLLATHEKWGHLVITPFLDHLGIPSKPVPTIGLIGKSTSVLGRLKSFGTVVHTSYRITRIARQW